MISLSIIPISHARRGAAPPPRRAVATPVACPDISPQTSASLDICPLPKIPFRTSALNKLVGLVLSVRVKVKVNVKVKGRVKCWGYRVRVSGCGLGTRDKHLSGQTSGKSFFGERADIREGANVQRSPSGLSSFNCFCCFTSYCIWYVWLCTR